MQHNKYLRLLTNEQQKTLIKLFVSDYFYADYEFYWDEGKASIWHRRYSDCAVTPLDDFTFVGERDYSNEFRLFMIQQENIDAVEYVKDLEAYIEEQKTNKIKQIKEKAKQEIENLTTKAENDRLFFRNMLEIKKANPD